MRQALHIFAKDARRFWPEILVSLVVTAAFVWIYPVNWAPFEFRQQLQQVLASAITMLVPITWAVMIARVVHDESLVGDRQFWVTRPYRWTSLLTAKAIFLLAFLYVPILIAQCALLFQAGFVPFAFVRGLLFNLGLLSCVLVLPMFAIATITSTFARMALTLLTILLTIIGFLTIVSGENGDVTFWGGGTLFISAITAAIVLQYATRRTLVSRLLLIGLVAVMIAAGKLMPEDKDVRRDYPEPASSGHAPVQLGADPDRKAVESRGIHANTVFLQIPLVVSGVAPGTAIKSDHVRAIIEAPNGLKWTSPWRSNYSDNYLPSTRRSTVQLTVDRSFYEKVKSMPLTVRLTFALTELRSGQATTVPLVGGDFSVPDFGICTVSSFSNNALACRFPMRQPHLSLVHSVLSKMPCSQGSSGEPGDQIQGQAWFGTLSKKPADFGIAPIWPLGIFFSNPEQEFPNPDFYRNYWLCPGSPVTVTRYEMAGRTQTNLTITGLDVTERSPLGGIGAVAGGIAIK